MDAMRSARVLSINLGCSNNLSKALGEILGAHFAMEELNLWAKDGRNYCDRLREGELSQLIWRVDPAIIFLVQPPNLASNVEELLQSIRKEYASIPVIVVVETGDPNEMLASLKLGAADFITGPLLAIDVLPRVWRLLDFTDQEETVAQPLARRHEIRELVGIRELIGENEKFLQEIEKIPLITKCDASVLISGETGTGKELCARAVHYLSPRARQPFIPVNCGAIPVELIENELFGHERGAFTGEHTSHSGLIQEADGGTLFLDEIDCLPLLAQVKLLRFIQEKEFRLLGSTKTCKADVRIIAATNINCREALATGKFRRDFFYRLNVISRVLPRLRERGEDVLLLARYFLVKHATQFNKPIPGFSPDAIRKLSFYDWPGNVRELEHIIMRAVILSDKAILRAGDIAVLDSDVTFVTESFRQAKSRMVAEFERNYIRTLLMTCHGNITEAARVAHKNRLAFWPLIRKHHISVQSLRSRGFVGVDNSAI